MDERLLERIRQVFSLLNSPLLLLDESGRSLLAHEGPSCFPPSGLTARIPAASGDSFFLRLPGEPPLILAARGGAAARDLLLLAASLVEELLKGQDRTDTLNGAYQRLLSDELQPAEVDAVASEFKLEVNRSRCVVLAHMVRVRDGGISPMLRETLPMAAGDALVAMDNHSAALVKDMTDIANTDELREFASAVESTLLEEEGTAMTMGIGEPAPTLHELSASYRQAKKAIEIGRVFRESENIHLWRTLLLERFMAEIPAETAALYHGLLFNRKTAHLFNEEILETVNMFLKKDLNLSDTARQLYIHRNTLVYRLDKIQRLAGLDLRRFDDAVTFRMLHDMKKCQKNKGRKAV